MVFDPELAVAVANGDLDFPDDEVKRSVEDAQVEEITPEDAGLDPLYFPPGYRERSVELAEVQQELKDLETAGASDEEIREVRRRISELRVNRSAGYPQVVAIQETGDYYGDDEWTGERFGEVYVENHIDGDEPDSELSDAAIAAISRGVANSETASAAFFGEIGVELTAGLPSIAVEVTESPYFDLDEGAIRIIENFSTGLGKASHTGDLPKGFTGTELITQGDRNTAALFHVGEFHLDFEADAMAAIIEVGPVGRLRGDREVPYWVGYDWDGRGGLAEHFGTDQRDTVFQKGTDNPALGVEVSRRLIESGNANVLIEQWDTRPPTEYTDRPPPRTGFLATVGRDPEVGGVIIASAAEKSSLQPEAAAAIDAIMGHHATVIYDDQYLRSHGIDPEETGRLSQGQAEAVFGIGPEEWSRLQGLVADEGFGGFLVAGNEALTTEALQNRIESSNGQPYIPASGRSFDQFGYVQGALERQWFETQLVIAKELDDDADRKNLYFQIGLGAGATVVTGFTLGAAPTAVGVATGVVTGSGLNAWAPEIWDSGNVDELRADQDSGLNQRQLRQRTQARLAYLAATGESFKVKTEGGADRVEIETITVSATTSEITDSATGAVTEETTFVFRDEDGNVWDPETAEDPLNWDKGVDGGYEGEAIVADWDSEVGRHKSAGYEKVEAGEVSTSESGESLDEERVESVDEYLGL